MTILPGRKKPLTRSVREQKHMVRYLGAGQARFAQKKHHLTSENIRWRIYLITLFALLLATGTLSVLRELG